MCPGRFCPREDFIPDRIQFFALSLNYGKHSLRSTFCIFQDFLSWGGFCPNKNFTFYVYHHSKHSCRSCFVFGGILSWGDFVPGDFVPATTRPYLCTPLQLTFIQSNKYFGKILSQGGFYPMKDSLWLTFIFCNFRGFCPSEYFVPHFTLLIYAPLRLTFILSNYCVWGDFVPGRILNLKEKLFYEKFHTLEKFYLAG